MSPQDLRGKRALVCASTGGLGEAVARGLAAAGATVAVQGRRRDRAEAIAASLPSAVAVPGDLSQPDIVFDDAERALGGIDVLVLNGPGPAPGTASGLDAAATREAIDGLLLSHMRLVERALPAMRASGWGRVLAIGSSGVAAPIQGLAASNIGRWALAAYLKSLATEVAPDGVTVNMVLPGRIATERVATLDRSRARAQGRDEAEVRAESQKAIPMGRYGEPHEFAAPAVFLASPSASFVTGVALRCDGGMSQAL